MTRPICRTALYMPANNERAMNKAPSLSADAIIVDLEDSVAPEAKPLARQAALSALAENNYGYRLRVLRVNGLDTEWLDEDLKVVAHAKPDAVLIPKIESADMIVEIQRRLDAIDSSGAIKIWAMMETPKAIVYAHEIGGTKNTCSRLTTFCIGNNDLARAANMKVTSDRSLLMPWLLQLVVVAKAFDLNILDGVYNDFSDLAGFAIECSQGAAMGMSGKTLIHPKQIEPANKAYSPSAQDISEAQSIVDAFARDEHSDAGVIQIDGRMVERLHLDMAQHTLNIAKRIKESRI